MDDSNPFDELSGLSEEEMVEQDKKTERQLEGWVANLAIGLGLVIAVLVFLAVLILYPAERVTAEVTDITHSYTENETLIETEPAPVSIEGLLNRYDDLVGQRRTILGFLQKRELDRGLVKYYVIDDFFRELEARGISQSDKELFPLGAKTKYPYEVTGTLRTAYQSRYIDVETVYVTTRPVNETMRVITHNKSDTETIIEYGTEKTTLFKYWLERYFGERVTECEDRTSANTCAKQAPYFCTARGMLIKDPVACGCPTGQELTEGECT